MNQFQISYLHFHKFSTKFSTIKLLFLQKFIAQVRDLKTTYKDDKINLTFLQILGSLGEYIKTNRGKAHPKTFKILNSVFSQFDEVVLNENMQEIEKKKILRAEMNRYKVLREQITQDKAAKKKKKPAKAAESVKTKKKVASPQPEVASTPMVETSSGESAKPIQPAAAEDKAFAEQIANAVDDIKRFIQAEFKTLREELNLIQK